MCRLSTASLLALVGLSSAAGAQGTIDRSLLMKYGGVLAPDCGNYLLPQLKYLDDSLELLWCRAASGVRKRLDQPGGRR